MDKAIDNYVFGKQKEVIAWKGESISYRSHRFFCPECLESVSLDCRGHFRHKNKTAQTIECEKRVNSTYRSSYERMGLPFYLVEQEHNLFYLYVGFSAISSEKLDEASKSGAYLYLYNGNTEKKKYLISQERFSDELYTLLRVESIPEKRGRFLVEYSKNINNEIVKQWTDHTDIWGNGQFFKILGDRCRKIRPLGSIITDTDYYYMGSLSYFHAYRDIVSISQYGQLLLESKKVPVYKLKINGGKKTSSRLRKLSNILMEYYKITLLMAESCILPLWPSCVVDDNYYIFDSHHKEAFFAIESPNDEPVVYRYYGGTTVEVPTEAENPHILKINLEDGEIPISVDRAFNGNIQYIRRQLLPQYTSEYYVDIIDENDKSIIGMPIKAIKKKKFRVVTSCASNVFHLGADGVTHLSKIDDEQGIIITDIHWGDHIMVFSSSWSCLLQYSFHKSKDTNNGDNPLLLVMQLEKIPVQKVDSIIQAYCLKAGKDPQLKSYISKYLKTRKIPVAVARMMIQKYGGC